MPDLAFNGVSSNLSLSIGVAEAISRCDVAMAQYFSLLLREGHSESIVIEHAPSWPTMALGRMSAHLVMLRRQLLRPIRRSGRPRSHTRVICYRSIIRG
jgi:hypothetical protein